jgi:PAS domain S-box-containing protein
MFNKATYFNSEGHLAGLVGVILDITERKQIETALRESERRLADIINFLPDATMVIDKEGKVIAWNRALEVLTGVKADDMLGKGNHENALPFYGQRRPILIDLVLKPKEEIEKSYTNLSRDGETLVGEAYMPVLGGGETYLWGVASALYDSQGNIVGAIESIKDITDRKRAEEALKESECRLADIINFLPDATMVIDRDGKVISWNQAMEAMTGVKAEDILGKGNYEHAIPFYGQRRPALIDLVLKSQEESKEEFEKNYSNIERKSGNLVGEAYIPNLKGAEAYLFGTAAALYDSKGEIVGAIESIKDITEHKRA